MNTVSVGDLGEVMAITKFTQADCIVSKPFSNNARYDLIVEINNKLYRVQVKTTTSIKDAAAMVFSTKTTNYVKGTGVVINIQKKKLICSFYTVKKIIGVDYILVMKMEHLDKN